MVIKNKGFTLVELVIVIAIIVILTGTGIASYNTQQNQQRSDSEVKKYRDVLELARRKAIGGEGVDHCQSMGVNEIAGYRVGLLSTDTHSYIMEIHCKDSTSPDRYSTLQTFTVDPNIEITSVPPVEFKTVSGEIVVTPAVTPDIVVPILNTSSNKITCISVNLVGVIDEYSSTNLACPTPTP